MPKSKMGKVKEGILIRASKQLKGLTHAVASSVPVTSHCCSVGGTHATSVFFCFLSSAMLLEYLMLE